MIHVTVAAEKSLKSATENMAEPIYFITGNARKFAEVQALLPHIQQLDLELPEIQSLDPHKVIRAKLQVARQQHDGILIVEDSSLALKGLNGLPGPFIRWFEEALTIDGLARIAHQIGNDRAIASNIIGYADVAGTIQFFEGSLNGRIVEPRGDKDFGWEPDFSARWSHENLW